MKTKIVTFSTRGDAGFVLCSTHGRQDFVAGFNAPVSKEPQLISCPFCRVNLSGKGNIGEGFFDSKGVAYVVDVSGNYRVLSRLNEFQKKRIQEERKKCQNPER